MVYNQKNTKVPCYKCPDRKVQVEEGKVVTCHYYCKRYKQFKVELENKRKILNEIKSKSKEADDYKIKSMDKLDRWLNRRNK